MKLKQTIAALAGAALLAAMPMSAYTYTAFAETDAFYTGSDASGQVETFTSGDYTYSLLTGKEDASQQAACLESCTSTEENLVIPETIDGYEVVALGDNTFMENTTAKTITWLGKESITSTTRMMISSTQPRKYPAKSPIKAPRPRCLSMGKRERPNVGRIP